LNLNGNNPATWPLNSPYTDNLGALFNHPTATGNPVSETIYSTSTVDTTIAGTTSIDYWAQNPANDNWLRASRDVVITAPVNDNQPVIELQATGTASSTP